MAWAARTIRALFASALAALFVGNAAAAPAGGDAAFTIAAENAVTTVEREDGFSGVILVARGDKVLLRKAAGFADRERNIRNTPETKFPLESVTKQFTAAAIMLLVQDGKVSLDDPISKFYSPSPPTWKDVTIKHLLTHASGIHDHYAPPSYKAQSYEDFIRLASRDTLVFPAGTRFLYSNTGYALLTAVIERVSGQSYADFLRSRMFAPLAMRNTGYGGVISVNGYMRLVTPTAQQVEWQNKGPQNLSAFGGFGGIYSTLDDMLRWSRGLESGRILSAASRQAMITDYGHDYGFGLAMQTKFGRKLIYHTGNDGAGHASIFDRFPEEELTVVVMTNNTGPTDSKATLVVEGKELTFQANAARKLVEQVERLYFGRAP